MGQKFVFPSGGKSASVSDLLKINWTGLDIVHIHLFKKVFGIWPNAVFRGMLLSNTEIEKMPSGNKNYYIHSRNNSSYVLGLFHAGVRNHSSNLTVVNHNLPKVTWITDNIKCMIFVCIYCLWTIVFLQIRSLRRGFNH